MGRRTKLRLAQSKPPLGQRFRGFDRQRQNLDLHRLGAAAHQEISLPIEQPIRLRFGHLGAVYWEKPGPFHPPYVNSAYTIYETNKMTFDDPILFMCADGIGGFNITLGVVPSVNAIISGVYTASGYGGSYTNPCQIPVVFWNYLGTADLSDDLLVETYGFPGGGYGDNYSFPTGGFTLPSSENGTNFYLYFNRGYMDWNTLQTSNRDTEVKNVLAPAYPLGCMVKIDLGVLEYDALASYAVAHGSLGPTAGYSVDNANWQYSDTLPAIPFNDEYVYQSNSVGGGTDVYRMQPASIVDKGDGKWWVTFIQTGMADAQTNQSSTKSFSAIRLFAYEASTEIATQQIYDSCQAFTAAQLVIISPPITLGFSDWSKLIRYDGLDAYIYGVSNSVAYATHFNVLIECEEDLTDGFRVTGFLHGLQATTGLGKLFPYVRNPPFPEAVCDQQFLQALFDLLPQGPAFPRQAGTNQPKLLTALADYLCDEQDRFQHLLIDGFPSSTVELLGE